MFIEKVTQSIEGGRASNYDKDKFDEMFERFDEDHNGYLSKVEMAQFIKVLFRNEQDGVDKKGIQLNEGKVIVVGNEEMANVQE